MCIRDSLATARPCDTGSGEPTPPDAGPDVDCVRLVDVFALLPDVVQSSLVGTIDGDVAVAINTSLFYALALRTTNGSATAVVVNGTTIDVFLPASFVRSVVDAPDVAV